MCRHIRFVLFRFTSFISSLTDPITASFQHGPDAIAACQEHVMNHNIEGLLHAMIRLKEILERMPNAFHSISTNPNSGDNFVSATEWVRWGKFSAPLSKRCPAASGLQFPPYLVMDAFLGRKKYDSFLGGEGLHLRAWLPSNLRAFIASIEYHYRVPEFVKQSGDPRLMGVLDGIIEAYTGERGFMGTHRYKVFGILEVASKTGRTETNGNSGGADGSGRPWEEVHRQFSDAMKERLEPYRGVIPVEPHQMRGTFEECRYGARILSRDSVDTDPDRSIAMVTLDIHDTGITYQPGDRLAIMPLNGWEECAKVAAALGLGDMLNMPVQLDAKWLRFAQHFDTISAQTPGGSTHVGISTLTVKDILRRGHLAPLTQDLVLKIHSLLHASSNTILQVLATDEWPVRGSLGDLLQAAVMDTPTHIWDRAFDLSAGGINGLIPWLTDIISVEVPRTYSISSSIEEGEVLPSTIQLTISRAEYKLCSTFAGNMDIRRAGVSSGFLNPLPSSDEYASMEDDEDLLLVGISRPMTFQLPLDGGAPCAYFAGGSGIAPFRSFWQSRIASGSVGRNILYLGVQSREKFCYEDELRPLVSSGNMEVHVAFSRDDRGLAYDPSRHALVERRTPPRYIDSLIADDQGATVCDLVMSKKQGGLGGYLYICGSVAVFDSIMGGIRRAIYNHRTATMDSTDLIIDTAFAERRIMLDVFMTPKPLPCNRPTIPLSELALHTGHRADGRIWIAVHGSVYDVTDFCSMHPGGTLIIKSNAGVDCSKSFDNLGHTNNPEVASLLTKFFVGHLTPKPDFGGRGAAAGPEQELSGLYDLWADYLRTTVETLVSQQFEMDDLMGSSKLWYQGSMINMLGVRIFYQYQSRLLQSGFSGLFGAKFQELVLKLSFAMVNAASLSGSDLSSETKLPDILGIVARAKSCADATATSAEVSLIGEYVCNGAPARFQERGIMDYANKSVQLDMELLEDIREEACRGMEAFGTVMALEQDGADSGAERVTAMCSILMHILERMARRLEVFYSRLAQHTIYRPEIEHNPARTRWGLVRRRIRDGSLFVLATRAGAVPDEAQALSRAHRVDFQSVLSRVQQTIEQTPAARPAMGVHHEKPLNERHYARALVPADAPSAVETYENTSAARRMSAFIDSNKRAMRRLSRVPATYLETTLGQMLKDADVAGHGSIPTPPASSPETSPSPTKSLASGAPVEDMMMKMKLNRRPASRPPSSASDMRSRNPGMMMRGMTITPERTRSNSPTHARTIIPIAPVSLINNSSAGARPLNTRSRSSAAYSVPEDLQAVRERSRGRSSSTEVVATHRPRASTSTLRSFQLGRTSRAGSVGRFAPTF